MADVTARPLQSGVVLTPTAAVDLPGYQPRPRLFPDGVKSPFVKEKLTGMIWEYQPFMDDMGDVLEPCWSAPAQRGIQIPVLADISQYAAFAPSAVSEAAQKPVDSNPSVLAEPVKAESEPKRKGGRPKGKPRASHDDAQ